MSLNIKNVKAYHFLRVFQVVIKFLPFFYLPNLLSFEDFASYSIINAIVTLSFFFLGLEIWYLYNRDISQEESSEGKGKVFSQQFRCYLYSYFIFLPFILLYIEFLDFPDGLIIVGICCFSHICQENSRVLIHLKQLNCSAVISVLQASWVVILPFGFILNLHDLLFLVFVFSLCSAVVSFIFLYRLGVSLNFKEIFCLDLKSFVSTLNKVKMLFLGAVFIKLGLFFPRFILDNLGAVTILAVLSFYQSLSLIQEFFVYTLIQSKYVPILLSTNSEIEKDNVRRKYFKYNSLAIVFLMITGCVGSILFAYVFLDKPIYYELYPLAVVCFISNALLCASNYYASLLYCEKVDWSHKYSGVVCFLFSSFMVLGGYFGGLSSISLAVGFLFIFSFSMFIFRYYLWTKVKPRNEEAHI
ncbi:hypothetical protein [Shewanella algae]|uniref:hypothetical protein n=1 Tax=Shewanella algae TaxID=38313 RepID=UPI0030046368